MTDKPTPENPSVPSSVPEDNRGVQPGIILTGIFGAFIGMGAVILASRGKTGPASPDRTPGGP